MAPTLYLTLGARTVMIARPANYQDLVHEIRHHFPTVSAVYSLAVVFQPAHANGGLLQNWVEVDPSAYSAVHEGAELFVNVVHPLTKEYILPLPGESGPNHRSRKQVRRTDGFGNRVGNEPGDYDATAEGNQLQDDQVSKFRPRGASSRPRGVSHKYFNSSLSLELERTGGDAFGSGWGGASERFRRSTKLVPNLKDCKEAVGQSVGESNFYPEDEEDQTADFKLGIQQHQNENQRPQATEAGWYAGAEPTQGAETLGETEAQHLAGGLEDEDDGKRITQFHSDDASHNWFAIPHSPQDPFGPSPRSHRGQPISTTPRWGDAGRVGQRWGGYRTPSTTRWVPYHGEKIKVPHYVRSRSCSPVDARAGNWGGNPGGWNTQHNEMHVADQEYSRIDAGPSGHNEAGHLTNGVQANGVHTNGNLTNGYPAAHSEVSQNPQHQLQHHGGSEWSPVRPRTKGYYWHQYPQVQGYQPRGQPNPKAFAGSRPRRDPGEVTYGSPRPRIQGGSSEWATIGRKKKTWTNKPVQEESDHEGVPGPNANNTQAWYGTPPPHNNLNRTTGHGGASEHRGISRHDTNYYQQKQRPGPEMSWGSDFWGGAPPRRTQRGASAQNDTPASRHWQ